jgi:serine/threonine protein kinase
MLDMVQCNILVDASCRACLADFGVSNILAHTVTVTTTATASLRGTMRWMAPELISADSEDRGGRPTRATDIYALSMVFWEVITKPNRCSLPTKIFPDSYRQASFL